MRFVMINIVGILWVFLSMELASNYPNKAFPIGWSSGAILALAWAAIVIRGEKVN